MTNQPRPLTNQESAFAAEHHHLLYSFLQENNLSEEEYYDVAVFGYLDAVCRQLHTDSGDFRQLAYTLMLSACNAYDEAQTVSFAELSSIEDMIADYNKSVEDFQPIYSYYTIWFYTLCNNNITTNNTTFTNNSFST